LSTTVTFDLLYTGGVGSWR